MSDVRAMTAGDAWRVAELYRRILRRRSGPPSAALVDEIRSFYCDGPFRHPDLPSLVHLAPDGGIDGFVGVNVVPMQWQGRSIRAAFCGSLMVENHEASPLAGAALLRAFLAGPQDVSFSETANAVAQGMWEKLRGQTLAAHSLDWVRVFRPAGFALAMAKPRIAMLAPLAGAIDRVSRRSAKSSLVRLAPDTTSAKLALDPVDPLAFTGLLQQLTQSFSVRPDWCRGYAGHVLSEALDKPEYGDPVLAAVRAGAGATLGAVLYHVKPGGIGRVLQILAQPGRMPAVLQALFSDAHRRGAAGLRGRTQPAILEASIGRSVVFATVASTVIHAKDPALVEAFRGGNGFVNGLAGETWCRLFGGGLDA